MNLAIGCVNIVHICRGRFAKNTFKVLEINNDDSLLKPFLDHYQADIKHMFPEYTQSDRQYDCALMILRNMNIAGVFLANNDSDGNLFVDLDYVIPAYRDCKVGDFLFNQQRNVFKQHGYSNITAITGSARHSKYLKRIGFKEIASDSGIHKFKLVI